MAWKPEDWGSLVPARRPHPDAREKRQELDRLTVAIAARRALNPRLPDLATLDQAVLAEAGRRDPMDFGQVAQLELQRRNLAELVPAMEKANAAFDQEQERKARDARELETVKLRLQQEAAERGVSRADFWSRSGAELIASCEGLARDDSKPRAERQRYLAAVQKELQTRQAEGLPEDVSPRRHFGTNQP